MSRKRGSDTEGSSSDSSKRARSSEGLATAPASAESSEWPSSDTAFHGSDWEYAPVTQPVLHPSETFADPNGQDTSQRDTITWGDENVDSTANEATVRISSRQWNTFISPKDGRYHSIDTVNKEVKRFKSYLWSDFSESEKLARAPDRVANEPHYIDHNTFYVKDTAHVEEMVTALAQLPRDRPSMSFDLEARDLGHESHLAFMQICDHERGRVYLIDTLVLGKEVFDIAVEDGTTLREIFENENRPKLAWDIRQDSCCLFGQSNIRVKGVIDLQILHLLLMTSAPDLRGGLDRGVLDMAGLGNDYNTWKHNKNALKSEAGHDWWNRPLSESQKKYAAGDVRMLYDMYQHAERSLTPYGMECAKEFSQSEAASTWVTQDEWKAFKERTLQYPAGIRQEFKSYWDPAKPLRRPGAAGIAPILIRVNNGTGGNAEDDEVYGPDSNPLPTSVDDEDGHVAAEERLVAEEEEGHVAEGQESESDEEVVDWLPIP